MYYHPKRNAQARASYRSTVAAERAIVCQLAYEELVELDVYVSSLRVNGASLAIKALDSAISAEFLSRA